LKRDGDLSVLARIENDRVVLDVRTVDDHEGLAEALQEQIQ